MKASMSSTERTIWNYFIVKGMSPAGVAGLMGNLYAESGLNPQNLQNTYQQRLGFTDATYTAAVDSGSYSNFVRDRAGYGLAQWTYWSRKEAMLNFARERGESIGDLIMQLDFMAQELKGYVAVWEVLRTARTVKEASDIVLTRYERPANQSRAVKEKRASYGQAFYDAYTAEKKEATAVSNKTTPELNMRYYKGEIDDDLPYVGELHYDEATGLIYDEDGDVVDEATLDSFFEGDGKGDDEDE